MNYELGNQCLLGLVNSQIRNLNLLSDVPILLIECIER